MTRLLAQSSESYIATLFEDYLQEDDQASLPSLAKLRKGGGSFRTVGQRHKQQLLTLMKTLQLTHPHFVRCIVPNVHKRAGDMDIPLVCDQLRCNGVLEGIRICRKGYPNRLPFAAFRQRYEMLCPDALGEGFVDGRTACQTLLQCMQLAPEKYRIGTSKVFFKATVVSSYGGLATWNTCISVLLTIREFSARRDGRNERSQTFKHIHQPSSYVPRPYGS